MRVKKGVVTSSKMHQTAVVAVHAYKNHPKYKKKYRISKKYYVHDPENKLNKGDEVKIIETKPISKLKRWKIEKIYKTEVIVPDVDTIAPSAEDLTKTEKKESAEGGEKISSKKKEEEKAKVAKTGENLGKTEKEASGEKLKEEK